MDFLNNAKSNLLGILSLINPATQPKACKNAWICLFVCVSPLCAYCSVCVSVCSTSLRGVYSQKLFQKYKASKLPSPPSISPFSPAMLFHLPTRLCGTQAPATVPCLPRRHAATTLLLALDNTHTTEHPNHKHMFPRS